MNERVFFRRELHTGSLILVNAAHPFREPEARSLVPIDGSQVLLDRRAAVLLEELMARLRGWDGIVPVSGWRSRAEQQAIWEDTLAKEGEAFTRQFVAVPGRSEHHTGLAIDLGERREEIDFVCPAFPSEGICGQFARTAARYGFILRYPAGKESVTGIAHEPWHFRFVGVPHALIIEARGLCLEEYLDLLREHPWGSEPLRYRGRGVEAAISFLPAGPDGNARAAWAENCPCSVSGNNSDGFIITRWNAGLRRSPGEAV